MAACESDAPKLLAASSLTEAARSWDADWRAQHGVGIIRVHAASSDLVRMVEAGAVGDVLVTADAEQMDRLEEAGWILPGSRIDLATNRLCLVTPMDAHVTDLDGVAHLAAVESGQVDFGVVYASDADRSKRVRTLRVSSEGEHDPIRYPAAILTASSNSQRAKELLALLAGEAGGRGLARAGLEPLVASGVSNSVREPLDGDAGPGLWSALWISLSVAAAAVLLDLVPALILAWILARKRFFGRGCIEALATLPLILPPTAIGWLLLRSLSTDSPLGGLELLLTWPGAVLAAAVMSFPLILRSARTAFEEIDPRMESMGSTLGLSRARVGWTITLPLARRGILAGLLLGFGRALGEFGATILVAGNIPGRTQTLSLAIFDRYQEQRDAEALTLVGVSALLAFGLVMLVERLSRPAHRVRGPRA